MNFSERLKELRTNANLTQIQLANELSVTQRAVSYYEKGRLPDEETLKKIAVYFDVSTDYLLGLSGLKNPYKEIGQIIKHYEDNPELLQFFYDVTKNPKLYDYFKELKLLNKKGIVEAMDVIKDIMKMLEDDDGVDISKEIK